VIVDRANFPRDKTCGSAVSPKGRQVLKALQLDGAVDRESYSISGLRLVTPRGHDVTVASPEDVAVICNSTIALVENSWYHVVYTKNGASSHIYINGVDRTDTVTNQTLVNVASDLVIAQDYGLGFPWYGALSEVAFYPTELSQARVLAHYEAALGSGVLASDDFNRADSANLGTNWSLRRGNDFTIASNKAVFTTSTPDSAMWYDPIPFPNTQYSQAALSGLSGTTSEAGLGVCVRCDTQAPGTGAPAVTFYGAVVNAAGSNNVSIEKWVANTYTLLAQFTQAWTDGDVLRLSVQGSTLRVYRNGVQIGTDVVDSSITSGSPGIYHAAPFTGGTIDNWEGGSGDLVASGRRYRRLVGPLQLGSSAALLYTAPGNCKTKIRHIRANNPSGSTRTITISIGADAAGTRIFSGAPILAGSALDTRRRVEFELEPGESLYGYADAATTVVLVVDGVEEGIG